MRNYTAPDAGPWVERFGGDGAPGFTVTVTRSEPLGPEAGGGVQARRFQAAVAWEEGTAGGGRSLVLARIVSY